ncbi:MULTISPECIES: Ms4533A family Cys-rich leader peptide [unclassified Streptomyces]
MSSTRVTATGHAAIELALIGVTPLCVADILCR